MSKHKKVKCPQCKGSGEIAVPIDYYSEEWEPEPCSVCNATGYVTEEEAKEIKNLERKMRGKNERI